VHLLRLIQRPDSHDRFGRDDHRSVHRQVLV
jgi:hypothetical protein